MPELPEVETTRRGIEPHLLGKRLRGAEVRRAKLRLPVPRALGATLAGVRITAVERRAKYLVLRWNGGSLISHLGMSGSWRVVGETEEPGKHDHLDLLLPARRRLRYRDPRRFGLLVAGGPDPEEHRLLRGLGPEPLGADFHGGHLHAAFAGRRAAVKPLLLDSRIVVGVGNIYACEALFLAGVRPSTPAGRLSRARCERLAEEIRAVLTHAVEVGGTTLRDFLGTGGEPGYFAQQLKVYGREGEPCRSCGGPVRRRVQAQRSTFDCPRCQR